MEHQATCERSGQVTGTEEKTGGEGSAPPTDPLEACVKWPSSEDQCHCIYRTCYFARIIRVVTRPLALMSAPSTEGHLIAPPVSSELFPDSQMHLASSRGSRNLMEVRRYKQISFKCSGAID